MLTYCLITCQNTYFKILQSTVSPSMSFCNTFVKAISTCTCIYLHVYVWCALVNMFAIRYEHYFLQLFLWHFVFWNMILDNNFRFTNKLFSATMTFHTAIGVSPTRLCMTLTWRQIFASRGTLIYPTRTFHDFARENLALR